jgi:hypothetical protein
MHKRVLLLGPTGVDKAAIAGRLQKRLNEKLGQQARFVDFENEYLKKEMPSKDWMTFLAQDAPLQATTWSRAWAEFKKSLSDETTMLAMHSTFVSGALGLRSPINIPRICKDFKPTLIISLIDDVFSMWARTEARAAGLDRKGRPSFEQLLVARRAEQFLGDVIRSHTDDARTRHILCAAGNSLDALVNLIIFDATVTYLSFPISVPRAMLEEGDSDFVDLINEAHMRAAAHMEEARDRAFISPLSIDELPILSKVQGMDAEDTLLFDCAKARWSTDELWGTDRVILPSPVESLEVPVAQVQYAEGTIRTDVGWRDRRLVQQSDSLAIICPKPPNKNRVTRGVKEEIETAVPLGIVCHYWQKPEWDPDDYLATQFTAAGSMGIGTTQALVVRTPSLEDLIRAKP